MKYLFLIPFFLNFSFCFSLPSFVNWSYDGAYKQDNGIRGEITLNGYWKWKVKGEEEVPPVDDEWFYRKVPGIGQFFHILDEYGKKITKFKGDELAWIERKFDIPEKWKERDIFLEIKNTKDGGKVFLDGIQIGSCFPNHPFIYKIQSPYKNSYRLTVLTKGIIDNVSLISLPKENKIINVFVNPSYRKKEIDVEIEIEKKDNLDFSITFYHYKTNEAEKVFKGKINSKKTNIKFKWENPRLWSYEKPELYNFVLEISKNGKVIDKTFPTIFGFREFWIEKGDFYLNGKILKLKSDSNVPFTMYSLRSLNRMGVLGNEDYIRNIVKGWKNLGLNSFHVFVSEFLNPDILFKVCDEEGYYIQVYMPSFSSYYQFLEDEKIKRYIEDAIGNFIKRIKQHPSLLFYFAGSGSHVWDYCPAKLDGSYNPDEIWGVNKENSIIRPIIEKYDNTRPVAHYSGGARDPIHTTMGYINFDADLQVHENWPYFWYKNKPRPLLPTEFSLPYYQAWFLRSVRGYERKTENLKPAFVEFSAIYFGDEPYKEILKNKQNWQDGKLKIPGQSPDIRDKLRALFAKNIIRSWRTYGISFAFHAEVRGFFRELKKPDVLNIDPRVPFYVPDQQSTEGDPFIDSPLTLTGIEGKKALSPFLAYIGGPDGNFTLKDHTYFSGEIIKKSAILINDYEEDLKGEGKWEIVNKETNKIEYTETFKFNIRQGERIINKFQINWKAPLVNLRKEFIIGLKVKTERENIEDEFEISVFPNPNPPQVKNQIYLYDPIGDTKNLLQKAKIKYTEINGYLPNEGILIIGRGVLKNENYFRNLTSWQTPKLLYNIDPAIKEGLKLIIFEQPLTNILGLKTEERRWRHSHISARNHPVLKGLKDGDFSYFRGYSNLMEDYPDPGPPPKLAYAHPERFWMWGNDNVVTTFPIVKPYVGAFRPILSCGFDLMETPLCEFTIGRGRIIFCQVDVTNRYGIDPVSTFLVNNLLEYMDKVEEPDTSLPEPVYAPEEGIEVKGREDYIFVPEKIPDGLTFSDFYFREVLKLKTVDGELFKKIKKDDKEIYIHTINLRDFKTRWQRAKGMRIIANLRIDQGGSSNEGPSFLFQGDEYALYPINWLEGFVHPYTHWRW